MMKTGTAPFYYRLKPADVVTLSYILISGFYVLVVAQKLQHPGVHLILRLLLILIIAGILYLCRDKTDAFSRILRDLYPLIFLAIFFYETASLGQSGGKLLDPWLIRTDTWLFGHLPSETLNQILPQKGIRELLYLGYFSFYLIIIFFSLGYFFLLPERFSVRFSHFLGSFYIFYLIFILFPSQGPQYFLGRTFEPEPFGFISRTVEFILKYGDQPTGAFPSSHVGMTGLILIFFLKDRKKWAFAWILPALILFISTVYIRAHYATDAIAGLGMSLLLYLTAPFYTRLDRVLTHPASDPVSSIL